MFTIEAPEIWSVSPERPILDVRSPAEYTAGHIPGALNLPLFNDMERAQVGTTYKQIGKQEAIQVGLDIVGPRIGDIVRQAQQLCPNGKVLIHCWRGGKRSGSVGWLLGMAGFDVAILNGGYKNYRKYILHQLGNSPTQFIVIGGRTGCGKTYILKALNAMGEQTIDLEGLARHKGSAFGWIGETKQPTTEQFENQLYEIYRTLDFNKRIWLENESRKIGTVYLPDPFWMKMKQSPLINISVPAEDRLQHLVTVYRSENKTDLILSFQKIAKKLGDRLEIALKALQDDDYTKAASIALQYYDKTYQFGLDNNTTPIKLQLESETFDPALNAQKLIALADSHHL